MPIYEYGTTEEVTTEDGGTRPGGCDECHERFEVFQSMSEDSLEECPYCGGPVKRLISGFLVSKGDPMSPSNLERLGFTQYTRKGKGNYEKTAGNGPSAIVDGNS